MPNYSVHSDVPIQVVENIQHQMDSIDAGAGDLLYILYRQQSFPH